MIPMRITFELPDPLFASLKARAALEGTTLKQLLRSFVEQGLEASDRQAAGRPRRAADLPRINADLPLTPDQLSNASLFALLSQPRAVQAAFLETPGVRLVDEAAASWPGKFCTDAHLGGPHHPRELAAG